MAAHGWHGTSGGRPRHASRAVALVAVATCFIAASCGKDGPTLADPTTSAPTTTNAPVVLGTFVAIADVGPPPPPEDPAWQSSIDAAGDFLLAHAEELDGPAVLLVAYLGDQWGVEELVGLRDQAAERFEPADAPSKALSRMLGPEHAATEEELAKAVDFDKFTGAAMHCDRYGYPANFDAELNALRETGGYYTTHAALAFMFARELGCPAPGGPGFEAALVDTIVTGLEAEGVFNDASAEQLAMLTYLGRPDLIDPRWYTAMLESQAEDGGWGGTPEFIETNWHTTALALWALGGYVQPDTPRIPLIPS